MLTATVLLISLIGFSATASIPKLDNGRIVGGEPVNITEVPFQVSLQDHNNNHFCGGSIINKKWVLTACHCVGDTSINDFIINAGATVYKEHGSIHTVEKIIMHPHCDRNDIALIKVKNQFKLGKPGIDCISLSKKTPADGTPSQVSGWGITSENVENLSSELRRVTVPIVKHKLCQDLYKTRTLHVTKTMLCAGYLKGGKDSCSGDSGGPLVADNKLVGVVSWGKGCAEPNYPGVYASVSYFHDWLIKTTKGAKCH